MNQQQIYDIVKAHLLAQMQQCGDDSSCLYRGPASHALTD